VDELIKEVQWTKIYFEIGFKKLLVETLKVESYYKPNVFINFLTK